MIINVYIIKKHFPYPEGYIGKGCNKCDIYYYSNKNVNEWIYNENCKYSNLPGKYEECNDGGYYINSNGKCEKCNDNNCLLYIIQENIVLFVLMLILLIYLIKIQNEEDILI